MNTKILGAVAAVAGVIALGQSAKAASLVNFDAGPISPHLPEFVFTNDPVPQLIAGPGAQGNGDGNFGPSLQTPGGLGIQTPLNVLPYVPPAVGQAALTSGTAFSDVSLILVNLAASAPAIDTGTGLFIQPLGKAAINAPTPQFALYSTDNPSLPLITRVDGSQAHEVLLLSGTITKASLTAQHDEDPSLADTGGVLSTKVAYSGGAIYNALVAAGGDPSTGSLSWSLLNVLTTDNSNKFSINDGSGFLNQFSSDGSGLFSTPSIPEPGSATLAGVAGLGMLIRRRRSVRI